MVEVSREPFSSTSQADPKPLISAVRTNIVIFTALERVLSLSTFGISLRVVICIVVLRLGLLQGSYLVVRYLVVAD